MQSGVRVGRDLTAQERRRSVLEAAIRCLARTGYEAVRLRDIAKEAGVSIGLLQHHFESREDLLEQAFRQASSDLLETWQGVTGTHPEPWRRIVALVEQLCAQEDPKAHCTTWTEFAAASARYPHLRAGFAQVYATWHRLLDEAVREGIAAGSFRPLLPAEDVVRAVLAHVDGCELAIASDIGVMTPQQMCSLTVRLARTLLRAED
jgi:AcrR family transcriptional regulator